MRVHINWVWPQNLRNMLSPLQNPRSATAHSLVISSACVSQHIKGTLGTHIIQVGEAALDLAVTDSLYNSLFSR